MNYEKLSFSIVICTYNRDEFLERTLVSLNKLSYSNFEVIVVNGPSTDETDEILSRYTDRIKILKNNKANLSISRNIGIRAAAGDIVAFLDDDAIPEPNWLDQIKEIYDQHNLELIGGVGGRVYGPGGDHFQFHNGYINVWGEANVKLDTPGQYINANSDKFNIMMGVNCTFQRNALIEVGGFDEYYEYFHDESDLCVRLIRAGFPIYHHQEAFVHHEFAKSHIRKSIYKLNWFPIVKNTVYFGIKNSKGIKGLFRRIFIPIIVVRKRLIEFNQWYRENNITKKELKEFKLMWWKGLYRGYVDGFRAGRKLSNNLNNDNSVYKKFLKESTEPLQTLLNPEENEKFRKYGICLLSRYYPPFGTGGVATYTKALAEGMVEQGHTVYVITSQMPTDFEVINGVKLIKADFTGTYNDFEFLKKNFPITYHNIQYSNSVANIVEDLFAEGKIKIVETPLWDYEGLVLSINDQIKTVVRLETPLRKAAEVQGWTWNADLELSAHLEKKLIQNSDKVITISENVKQTICEMYQIDPLKVNSHLVPLGLYNENFEEVSERAIEKEFIKILFVGRLEPRKGIDILLKAFEKLNFNNSNIKLVVAGNNNIKFADGLTIQEIFYRDCSSPILEKVEFLGEVSSEELKKQYKSCDIFVAPSRYESFGLVYLEAMRYKKAVIGTKVGGVPEVITDYETGLLVDSENIDQLVSALDLLIMNSELRIKLGENAYSQLKIAFTVEKMIKNTVSVYEEALNI